MADHHEQTDHHPSEDEILNADEIGEEYLPSDNEMEMDSGDENNDNDGNAPSDTEAQEIIIQNDSIAYFDAHRDSVFAIAQHPKYPHIIATGGSEGDADDAPGKGYLIDASAAPGRPVFPTSFNADSGIRIEGTALKALFSIDGHADSISAMAFSSPGGQVLVSGGLDGRVRAYVVGIVPGQPVKFKWLCEAAEVPEVIWVSACPHPGHPNIFAIGGSDGSVWVYTVKSRGGKVDFETVNTYYLHMGSCTAGAWTPDGKLLATVADDSSMYVWDVFGEAVGAGYVSKDGQSVVSLKADDQRFEVEGGLYSIAMEPSGKYVAVGGAGGAIRIVSLPLFGQATGAATDNKTAGRILASLQTLSDTVEALSFSYPVNNIILLAAGSVDGTIVVFDASKQFAVRRKLPGAHEDFSVVKLEWVSRTWLLTSCGMDGVVRRWDLKAMAEKSLVKEWRGHRGDGEGGGVLGFVQGETGERVITAGDDGIVLVFEA